MKIIRNTMTVSDIFNMMKSNELVINRSYQRAKGLWPDNSRSYFIDTVLNDFPFPKVVIRQTVDLKTKKSQREIIDGQQRLTTIRDFIENKFKLTSVSKKFGGSNYEDLDDDVQTAFLAYEISIDNVTSATTDEILEIFRRINSYTLPLNTSEKRHATYQGKFKWFISDLTIQVTPFFESFDILTLRDIARMGDADLLTECCQLYVEGIQNRSPSKLEALYSTFDSTFESEEDLKEVIIGCFEFLKNNFLEVFENCHVQSYNFYSLMGALMFNKFGLPDSKGDLDGFVVINDYCSNVNSAINALIRIFTEVDEKEVDGEYPNFVMASVATTHSYRNRLTRLQELILILQQ